MPQETLDQQVTGSIPVRLTKYPKIASKSTRYGRFFYPDSLPKNQNVENFKLILFQNQKTTICLLNDFYQKNTFYLPDNQFIK